MRFRSVVLSACVVVAALALTATTAAGSARVSSTKLIICPQVRGETPTCCGGPPIDSASASCCPTVVACAQRITMSASEDPMVEGSKIVVSGDLVESSNVGQTIALWQRVAGVSSFSKAQTTTTGSDGAYSFTLAAGAVQANRAWYVTGGGQTSATLEEDVSALVSLKATHPASGGLTLNGTVTPAHAREVVLLQRLVGSKWRTFARSRLSRKSKFTTHLRGRHTLRASIRAVLAGDRRNIESFSPTLKRVALPR